MIIIGIDPGVSTGYAAWDATARQLSAVQTLMIHEAMANVAEIHRAGLLHSVTFEDARLRKWFGGMDAEQARYGAGVREGVGSVKRDCSIWADYLGSLGVPYRAQAPRTGLTKITADLFRMQTGWVGRTSEHARDAALLVFGQRVEMLAI